MRILRFAAPLATLAAAACVRAPDPLAFTEDVVSVHTVLHAFETEPRVWVLRSTFTGGQGAGSATATLASGAASLALTQRPGDDPRCAAGGWGPQGPAGCLGGTLPEPVAPGSRWTLTAALPGLATVHGATTVPELPVVVRPAAGARVLYGRGPYPGSVSAEVELEWSAPGAPRVEFTARATTPYREDRPLEGVSCWVGHPPVPAAIDRAGGTRTLRIEGMYCGEAGGGAVAVDSVALELVVTAFDAGYAEFALDGSGTSRGRGGLEGGYGVFGSAASSQRRLMLVPGG